MSRSVSWMRFPVFLRVIRERRFEWLFSDQAVTFVVVVETFGQMVFVVRITGYQAFAGTLFFLPA